MRKEVAGATGLEPATSAVTGQRSNQLSYVPEGELPNNSSNLTLCALATVIICYRGTLFRSLADTEQVYRDNIVSVSEKINLVSIQP